MSRGRALAVRLSRWLVRLSLLTVVLLAVGWWGARPATPDAFYDAPESAALAAGVLLRSEPFMRNVPSGARAWRLLYGTTRGDGSAVTASALVVAPVSASSPHPVIAWAHGTTGLARGCAPSVMADPFANVPGLAELLGEGWVYVATDYPGLGTAGTHAYLVGDDAARAVLDSVRAARRLPSLSLGEGVVVWGHSQGGNSALWTGIRAPAYAPDVALAGVAALAPASDLVGIVAAAQTSIFGKIVSSYLAHAYAAVYPDVANAEVVWHLTRPLVRDIAGRCVGDRGTLLSVLQTMLLPRGGIFDGDPTNGPLGARLRDNTPLAPVAAPVLIAQGSADDLVLPGIQRRFVQDRCKAGQTIDYRAYESLDHVALVGRSSPLVADLVQWSRDRFAGRPVAVTCLR